MLVHPQAIGPSYRRVGMPHGCHGVDLCANFLKTLQICRKSKSGHTIPNASLGGCCAKQACDSYSSMPKNWLNLSIHCSKHSCSQVPAERSLQATFSSAYSTFHCHLLPASFNLHAYACKAEWKWKWKATTNFQGPIDIHIHKVTYFRISMYHICITPFYPKSI